MARNLLLDGPLDSLLNERVLLQDAVSRISLVLGVKAMLADIQRMWDQFTCRCPVLHPAHLIRAVR